MELDTIHRSCALWPLPSQSHDSAIFGPGADLEGIGHRISIDDERVIACRSEGVVEPGKQTSSVMVHRRCLSMHGPSASHDRHAMNGGNGLVAKADAENWNATFKRTQQIRADARFIWSAGPRRNHQTGGVSF